MEDSRIWNLITAIHDAERNFFGQRISRAEMELKGKKLLKRKTFRLASQLQPIPETERTRRARECLHLGRLSREKQQQIDVSRRQLTALAQAKLAFVERILELCAHHQTRALASIVDRDAPRPEGMFLRKDYAYLFERFFYLLDELPGRQQGLIVFDELERSRSHILIDQMDAYFEKTAKGRHRSSRIIPEPFFVHSELSSLIQVADLIAYILVWGVRVGNMTRPRREELGAFSSMVCELRHRAVQNQGYGEFPIWSFAVIDDLRPRTERAGQ